MKICFEVKERERESRLMIEIKEEGEIKRECDQRLGERKREKTKKKKIQHRNYRVLDIILLSAQKIITALTFRIDHLQEKAVIFGVIKPFGCQETPLFLSQTSYRYNYLGSIELVQIQVGEVMKFLFV